jgi:hypothetical protein
MLQAQVLGHNLAVAGMFAAPNAPVAQGVVLVDTQTWTTRTLDAKASFFSVLGDRVVTFGQTALPPRRRGFGRSRILGHGLTLYDETGRRLAHLYGTRGFQYVELTPGYGHVIYNGKSTTVPTPGKRYARGRLYYSGPNDQLVFGIDSGTVLGGGTLGPREQRFGSSVPIFRGSVNVGESGDRLASASGTPRRVAATASTEAQTGARFTMSNEGHEVPARPGRTDVLDRPYRLFLLGTADGIAFYRIAVTSHFTCWGIGDAGEIGSVGGFACPGVVGAEPLQTQPTFAHTSSPSGKQVESRRLAGTAVDQATSMALVDESGRRIATTPVVDNLFSFPRPYPKRPVRIVALDARGNRLTAHPEWGRRQTPPRVLLRPHAPRLDLTPSGR